MNSTATEVETLVRHLQQSSLGRVPSVRLMSLLVLTDCAVIKDETDLNVLEWLSPLNPQQTHVDVRSQRLPGTGLWLLDKDEFKRWRYDALSPHILWCHGIPGAGKTVLAWVFIPSKKCALIKLHQVLSC